ncbi:MAG TPA: hypothetical protein PLB34_00555 [Rhodoblastus sp.]|nr:hypothetical protein [Rhodoblastus sp.]
MGGDPSGENKDRIPPTFTEGPIYPPPRNAQASSAQASSAQAGSAQAGSTQPGLPRAAAAPPVSLQPAPAPAQRHMQTAPAVAPVSPADAPRPVFVSDAAGGPDSLGRAAPLARLSELIAHRGAQGPLSIALTGGPGSGKSHALMDLVEGASLLSTAALAAPSGPFLPRIVALRLEAPDLGDAPDAAIAERLHARLSREYPHIAQRAAEEAAHAASDPRQTARALADNVDEARRRVAAERAARDEAVTRRARLTETVLYETPGSQIDGYARSHRGKIDPALRAFGFAGADPTADYKGLVQTLAESGGTGDRFLASLRALWAYQGQKKLVVFGVILFLFSWLLGAMAVDRSWLDPLQSGGDSLKGAAGWMTAHIGALKTAARFAELAGFACFALLLWRAWRFAQPLWRGAQLLDVDIAARKTDLDHQIAHHAQRVDALAREADALAQRAAEAEKRAGGGGASVVEPAFMHATPGHTGEARAYFAALDAACAGEGDGKSAGAAPARYVIAIDSLDRLPPQKGLALLQNVASALARPAFALVTAFDPRHFDSVEGAGVELARVIQTPLALGAMEAPGWSAFVEQLAGRAPSRREQRAPQATSRLDLPLAEPETRLLTALASLAGPAPRNVNRLVNAYRLARHDAPDDLAALAFQLALVIGGTRTERDLVAKSLASSDPAAAFAAPEAGPRVAAALRAAATAQGGAVTTASAIRAAAVARMWTL